MRLDHIGNVMEFTDYEGFDIWRSLKNSPTYDNVRVPPQSIDRDS